MQYEQLAIVYEKPRLCMKIPERMASGAFLGFSVSRREQSFRRVTGCPSANGGRYEAENKKILKKVLTFSQKRDTLCLALKE